MIELNWKFLGTNFISGKNRLKLVRISWIYYRGIYSGVSILSIVSNFLHFFLVSIYISVLSCKQETIAKKKVLSLDTFERFFKVIRSIFFNYSSWLDSLHKCSLFGGLWDGGSSYWCSDIIIDIIPATFLCAWNWIAIPTIAFLDSLKEIEENII